MRPTLNAIAIVLVTSAAAGAQTTSEQLLLDRTAAVRGEVVVRLEAGRGSVRGRLVDATEAALEVETRSGPRFLNLSRITQVDQPGDPIWDGVFRGVGTAATWCALMCEHVPDVRERAAGWLSRVAVGGLIGGLLDRKINGGRTLYRRGQMPRIGVDVVNRSVAVGVGF